MPTHEQLMDTLADTRRALMSGDIAALAGLAAQTEAALDGYLPTDAEALAAVRHQAEGNAACLGAALAGLRAARARLAEIERLQTSMGYDDRGQRRSLSSPEGLARRL